MEITATKDNFKAIIEGELPVLVDFWATWCGPCRALSPVVEEVAKEYEGRVAVVKCNVDDCPDIAAEYGIRNIPTLIYVKNGQIVDRTVGNLPKEDICEKLDSLLA